MKRHISCQKTKQNKKTNKNETLLVLIKLAFYSSLWLTFWQPLWVLFMWHHHRAWNDLLDWEPHRDVSDHTKWNWWIQNKKRGCQGGCSWDHTPHYYSLNRSTGLCHYGAWWDKGILESISDSEWETGSSYLTSQ